MNAPELARIETEEHDSDQLKPSLIDKLTYTYFGIPLPYYAHLDRIDFARHKSVVLFTLVIVLPLSALAFGHFASLLIGDGAIAGVSDNAAVFIISAAGATFGVLLTWLNNSGTTIVLRNPGSSWQKSLGVLVRILFIALNVLLFTAAIVTFSLRDRIQQRRLDAAQQQIVDSVDKGSAELAQSQARRKDHNSQISTLQEQLKEDGAEAAKIRADLSYCRALYKEISEARGKLNAQINTAENAMQAAPNPSPERARAARSLENLQKSVREYDEKESTQSRQCSTLQARFESAKKEHQEGIQSRLQDEIKELKEESNNQDQIMSDVKASRGIKQQQIEIEKKRSLGSELIALYGLMENDKFVRLTAAVIALFVALIDLMPVVLGWSLKGGAIDAYLQSQESRSRERIKLEDELFRERRASDLELAREQLQAQRAEKNRTFAQQSLVDAELDAARHYANSVSKLEAMLKDELGLGADKASINQVRSDTMKTLSQLYESRESKR